MPTFGRSDLDVSPLTGSATIENAIRGGVSTCPSNGTADSISIYVKHVGAGTASNVTLKCAIYRVSDGVLIGQTDELVFPDSDASQWRTATFASPPSITSGVDYILCGWCNSLPAITISLVLLTTGTGQAYYADSTETYGASFPSTSTMSLLDSDTAIGVYCTYTETASGQKRHLGITGVGV